MIHETIRPRGLRVGRFIASPRSDPAPIPNSYWLPDGRVLVGEYPGAKNAFEAGKKLGALVEAGITRFFDLTTPADGMTPYEPLVASLQGAERCERCSHEIPDMDVPDRKVMTSLLDAIDAAVEEGHLVYVHCWGGVGRSGTVAGCYLVRHGYTGDEALEKVTGLFATMSPEKQRRHPEGSPQTDRQRRFVREWSEARIASRMNPRAIMQEVARGCLLGGAVGDALGAALEFMSLAQIRGKFGQEGCRVMAPAYGGIGRITDDTQMTLFTAEGMLRATARCQRDGMESGYGGEHRYSSQSVIRNAYRRWLSTQTRVRPVDPDPGWLVQELVLHARRAPGNTCLSALEGNREGSVQEPINDSKGCGTVMRVAPVGLLAMQDVFEAGAMTGALTHGHPSGYLAAGALAVIINRVARHGDTLGDAVNAALERLSTERAHEEVSAALETAMDLARSGQVPTPEVIESLGGGWVAEEALGIAVYCALVAGEDFRRGVELAVNHSGDSDSTGAITGNILGAMLGPGSIPRDWLERLELRDVIVAVADDLVTGFRYSLSWNERYPGC